MEKKEKSKVDNVTKYGEMVCTAFEWLPLDKQKENAEKLAEITKKQGQAKKKENKA